MALPLIVFLSLLSHFSTIGAEVLVPQCGVCDPPSPPSPPPPVVKLPPPPPPTVCPAEMGACLEPLHGWLGHLASDDCCAVVDGIGGPDHVGLCLCDAIELKALSLKLYVVIAEHIALACGVLLPPLCSP